MANAPVASWASFPVGGKVTRRFEAFPFVVLGPGERGPMSTQAKQERGESEGGGSPHKNPDISRLTSHAWMPEPRSSLTYRRPF